MTREESFEMPRPFVDKPLFWQSALSEYQLEESRLVNGVPWLRYVRNR